MSLSGLLIVMLWKSFKNCCKVLKGNSAYDLKKNPELNKFNKQDCLKWGCGYYSYQTVNYSKWQP